MDLRFEIEARNQSVPFNRATLSLDAVRFNIVNFILASFVLCSSSSPISTRVHAYEAFRRKFATNLCKEEIVVISSTKKFDINMRSHKYRTVQLLTKKFRQILVLFRIKNLKLRDGFS